MSNLGNLGETHICGGGAKNVIEELLEIRKAKNVTLAQEARQEVDRQG